MSGSLRTRLERLERRTPLKGRWVEPDIRLPDGPSLVWDPYPDRLAGRLVIPRRDDRFDDELTPEEVEAYLVGDSDEGPEPGPYIPTQG